MRKLKVSSTKFTEMLSGLIQSGVTFDSYEDKNGDIVIEFNGGY